MLHLKENICFPVYGRLEPGVCITPSVNEVQLSLHQAGHGYRGGVGISGRKSQKTF